MTKITTTYAKSLRPKDKMYRISDTTVGLFLKVHPSGSKVWEFSYRSPVTKNRDSCKIGQFSLRDDYDFVIMGVQEARLECKKKYAGVLRGIDPKRDETAVKFKTLAEMWYREWSKDKAHPIDAKRAIENHVYPVLADIPVDKIEPKDIARVLYNIQEAGITSYIGKVSSWVRQIMAVGVSRGYINSNPSDNIQRSTFANHITSRHRTLALNEIYTIYEYLHEKRSQVSKTTRLCAEFIMRTGARSSEIMKAEWSEVDWERGFLIIPGHFEIQRDNKGNAVIDRGRMKIADGDHVIPLIPRLREILLEMKSLEISERYIFPHNTKPSLPLSEGAILNSLKSRGVNTTVHGLRSLMSTMLNELRHNREVMARINLDKDIIEATLAHTDGNKIRATYNLARYLTQIENLLAFWSDFLDMCSTEKGNKEALEKYDVVVI